MALFGKKNKGQRQPPPELVTEALANPGGWVYEIDGDQVADPDGDVPPEAIIGAWKVDDRGLLTGDFQSNPNYRAQDA